MKCPTCTTPDLLMTERSGIEIDYCPLCRGVWLDRGELDKIIERSMRETTQPTQAPVPQTPIRPVPQYYDNSHGHHGNHHDSHRSHQKKSIWKELFD
ncbi:MAG: zf-TFIIB domain-containing protein [Rhodoferax sp.]|uniref:TFIIB-type zinc ribbon-containing protein n=1 Tax=Rhodoferax sp. TaxID=50421 RepID=UPI00260F9388|nr:zf-TFIIB domain-containing protein [Rhodoferax sp.]MDD2880438.1 zf-TFIIB domain-containing protein [Rhodoferax sp.]